MPRKLIILSIVLLAAYVGLCAALYLAQRSLIYFPQRSSKTNHPTLTLAADGAQVRVTVQQRDGVNAVIYFGGNAEDVTASLPGLSAAFPDHTLYLMNYRGYGGSTGSPSEAALVADAQLLFDEAFRSHKNITVVGRSLGSGVAVQLASQRPVSRLILVTPYNSIQELAQQQFPYFPVRWILRDKFESWKYAERIATPTLLVMAEHDEVIPAASTHALYGHFAKGIATLTIVPRAKHNDISNYPAYNQLLRTPP
ncbi:alpha/beta fold hydrolase [Duganella sp. FT135W]|uniref:Alpha/beta fold hydrolase n=1 Tax=Duganella flavida TaxID=2692175 RepID=A0A6L8K9X4_9BURK|nr:alpha/beta fold hydrolase [Duganella flavida]MYM24156.1 alpha/beta fold hydrolase [Duganella flavida]